MGRKKRDDEGMLGEKSEERLAKEAEEYELKKRQKDSKNEQK